MIVALPGLFSYPLFVIVALPGLFPYLFLTRLSDKNKETNVLSNSDTSYETKAISVIKAG